MICDVNNIDNHQHWHDENMMSCQRGQFQVDFVWGSRFYSFFTLFQSLNVITIYVHVDLYILLAKMLEKFSNAAKSQYCEDTNQTTLRVDLSIDSISTLC